MSTASTMKITFVLPVKGGGGGAHSVAQEVAELARLGVDVQIAVNARNVSSFATTYSDMPRVLDAVVGFEDAAELGTLLVGRQLAICTIFSSVDLVAEALGSIGGTKPRVGYYIQDYEPLFCAPGEAMHAQAVASYGRFPGALLFAKTDWIRDAVRNNHGIDVEKVSPSLDTELYHPGPRRSGARQRIAAMVRPQTPRRAPRRTMAVLHELRTRYGNAVDIDIFGCNDADLAEHQLVQDFDFVNHGRLMRHQVAALLRNSDIFIDLSDYQAFGRTGLEAMACGCRTVLPAFGGATEYAHHGIDSVLVDTRDDARCVEAVSSLIDMDDAARAGMRRAALASSRPYSVRSAALSELDVFERYLAAA